MTEPSKSPVKQSVPGGRHWAPTDSQSEISEKENLIVELKMNESKSQPILAGDALSVNEDQGLSPQHRFVSQSVPRICPESPGDKSIDFDQSPHNASTMTIGNKKKMRMPRFLKKILRPSKSSTSLNTSVGSPSSRFSFRTKSFFNRSRTGSAGSTNYQEAPLNNAGPSKSNPDVTTACTTVPATTGIRNHGNTCFMNAVVQGLSHTEMFSEFMVTDKFKVERRKSKVSAKKFGTGGEVTDQLSQVLKCLWTNQTATEASFDFLTVVGKYANQYRGFSQHDAQEFLIWLLDKLHEDLNTAGGKKKRKLKVKNMHLVWNF